MENPRTSWTDERLDDLSSRVTRMDVRLTNKIEKLDAKVDARFEKLEASIDTRFSSIDATLHSMERSMIFVLGTVMTVFGGVFLAGHL